MNTDLLKVALRQQAVYVPNSLANHLEGKAMTQPTAQLLANCKRLGFSFSEPLLHALNTVPPTVHLEILDVLREVTGVKKNWTPLVRQWDIPTGARFEDHVFTYIVNLLGLRKGPTMPCGHIIPANTFPLERYNGCPYCGTPFDFGELDYDAELNEPKVLELWTEQDLAVFHKTLLESPVALDATQTHSLKLLTTHLGLPSDATIAIKENLMVAIDGLIEADRSDQAAKLFRAPNDVLRYLWYRHTGYLQVVEPKTIVNRMARNAGHSHNPQNRSKVVKAETEQGLKLKYTRAECKRYASWLNSLPMSALKQCEDMHPKRNMWVRFIRALRLAEYAKRPGFEKLAEVLDHFYNETYEVYQGRLEQSRLRYDATATFELLKQRPGLFARSLFANMLWYGKETALAHFREIMHEVPPRLIYTLFMYAPIYFDKDGMRSVSPLGGTRRIVPKNKLLQIYPTQELKAMQDSVKDLMLEYMRKRFEVIGNSNSTVYIDPELDRLPLAIGERSEQVEDLPATVMGTRFPVEGDSVRLFMQWGHGLPKQHLDMDLSCMVAYESRTERCSYSQLTIDGCQHSGDVIHIPHMVGTAEYIDVDVQQLSERGAQYVSFTCNAYSSGNLSPNMVVGWMNSKHRMRINNKGVAYDPTAVQHQVHISQGLSKGLVFGVLDVAQRELVWLEMPFHGQVVQNLNTKAVVTLLNKLNARIKVGEVLRMRAKAQGLAIVPDPEQADEVYDLAWALNQAEVNKLLLGV